MALTYSDSPGISQRTTVFAAREMLKHAAPVVVLDKFGVQKEMPKNKGTAIKFRRPVPFAAATVPLQEGVTPSTTQFRYEDVSGNLKQYGFLVGITDVIEDTHEDPVLRDASQQVGENAGRTIESLTYGVLKGGTNVFYANGAARNAVNTVITLAKQRAVVRALKVQKGAKVSKILDASPDFGTRAVEAAYIGVVHTDLENDIRGLPGFAPTANYGTRSIVHEAEFGSVEEVRYISSPDLEPFQDAGGAKGAMISTTGVNADVYPVLYFAKDGYGTVALRGVNSLDPTIIPVGQKTKDDPLGQRGYVGWKIWFLALILNQAWVARLEVAATEL